MTLPENTFAIVDSRPTDADADPHGNVMYFCKQYGWMVSEYDSQEEMISNFNCTHWTYTPEQPT